MIVLCARTVKKIFNTEQGQKCPCRTAVDAGRSYSMPRKSSVAGAVVNSMVKRRDDHGQGTEDKGDSGSRKHISRTE